MRPLPDTLAAPQLTMSLADLGQRLLELQRSLVDLDPAAAEEPGVVDALRESASKVERLHLLAWSATAELGSS